MRPAMSPDMNPTEHVWDFIGRKINQRNLKCQNIEELRTAILQEWKNNLRQLHLYHKSSCAQNVVVLKRTVSLAPNPCTTVGRA
jgi:hypothetical protein